MLLGLSHCEMMMELSDLNLKGLRYNRSRNPTVPRLLLCLAALAGPSSELVRDEQPQRSEQFTSFLTALSACASSSMHVACVLEQVSGPRMGRTTLNGLTTKFTNRPSMARWCAGWALRDGRTRS